MSTGGPPKRRATQGTDKSAKRTRVSRACDQCRLAREKCNGLQPTCSTCSKSRRACTYTANVKKRGIQPGYIRALELALAYLFQHDPENEALVHERLTQNGPSSLLLSRDSKESNRLHKRWRRARFYTDVDRLLSGGEPSRHDQSEPLSSDSDDESIVEAPSSTAATTTTHTHNLKHDQNSHVPTQDSCQWPSTPLRSLASLNERIAIPSNSWRLLEVYFVYSQAWLPICSKQDVLRTLYSYPTEGLALSPGTPGSGHHAELWSILAVATMHDTFSSTSVMQQHQEGMTPAQLYATARALIPDDVDQIDMGHIKALINLALVSLKQTSPQAAWVLVGLASRVLQVVDQTLIMTSSRHKHVFHACFLLDSLLALHFSQRPYFQMHEARKYGKVDEDGLDEWQPWNGGYNPNQQPRLPTMALSSLNVILDLIVLLNNDKQSAADALVQLDNWEASLPSTLAFVRSSNPCEILNPATVVLRTAYYCSRLALTASEPWLLRSLELFKAADTAVGWQQLPPILPLLFRHVQKHATGMSLDHNVRDRLVQVQTAVSTAWPKIGIDAASTTHKIASTPMPTDQSLLQPFAHDAVTESFPSGPVPVAMQSVDPPTGHIDQILDLAPSNQADERYQQMPSDLESFFDELASLDAANNPDNQPQFMQNLGFAPDANMADLFSEYIPISTAFMAHGNHENVNLDHYGFYGGS